MEIRDITACRFAKGMPEILSYKFVDETEFQEEYSSTSSAVPRGQIESPGIADNKDDEVIMEELGDKASPRTVASEPSDSNQDDECESHHPKSFLIKTLIQ